MNTLNRKNISVALLITLGAIFSVNVNANTAEASSIERSLSEMVIAQGQQVMSDLTVQLQQSIVEEVNSFTINFSLDETITDSLAWLSEEKEEQPTANSALIKQTKQLEVSAINKNKSL